MPKQVIIYHKKKISNLHMSTQHPYYFFPVIYTIQITPKIQKNWKENSPETVEVNGINDVEVSNMEGRDLLGATPIHCPNPQYKSNKNNA